MTRPSCDTGRPDAVAPLGECPPGHDPTALRRGGERVAEMQALLVRVKPATDAEALQALRAAFPGSSLAARVAAMAAMRS